MEARKTVTALSLIAFLLAGCAHMVNTLDHVKIGMSKQEAIASVGAFTPSFFTKGSTEYILYRVITNLFAPRSHPHSVLFVRLENGVVVAKGVVGSREEARIKKIHPSFDLRLYQM